MPEIEAFDKAKEGEVDWEASYKEVSTGDMVLCRTTAPLVKLCMEYIVAGVKAYVKGQSTRKELINLLKQTDQTNLEKALDRLAKELEKISSRESKRLFCSIEEAKTSPRYLALQDKIKAIQVIGRSLTQVRQVINRIEVIFSESTEGICLSTIHKAKD